MRQAEQLDSESAVWQEHSLGIVCVVAEGGRGGGVGGVAEPLR